MGPLSDRPPLRSLAAAMCLVALAACGVDGLSFVQDERVDIIRPGDRSEVRVPFRVDWTVKDFAVGPDAGSFGIFVDREPTRSGQTLAWLFRGDDVCRGTGRAACATPEFLAQRSVYSTTDTSFEIERVPRLTGDQRRRQFHEVTVVLLDRKGERVGEGAWSVQVEVKDDR